MGRVARCVLSTDHKGWTIVGALYLTFCCYCSDAKLCSALCEPMDCSLPGSSIYGISQARILEWMPFPSPGDIPNPGMEPTSPELAGGFFTTEPPEKQMPYLPPSKSSYHQDVLDERETLGSLLPLLQIGRPSPTHPPRGKLWYPSPFELDTLGFICLFQFPAFPSPPTTPRVGKPRSGSYTWNLD